MEEIDHRHREPPDSGSSPKDRARILLVDDEDRFRKNLAERLAMRGYGVQDIADGEEAIKIVRLTRPDVVALYASACAIGPITVPMAVVSGTNPLTVGLATAFASSFANMLIVGTPNNAIANSLVKDLDTGEQLIMLSDFFKHGFVICLLSFALLWGWAIFGYWRRMGFYDTRRISNGTENQIAGRRR